jgi:TolA-binding protein
MPTTVNTTSSDTTSAAPAASPAAPGRPPRDTKRVVALGAGLVAVLIGAFVIFGGGGRKEEFAQRQLTTARSAAEMGDLPAAAQQFQTLIETYEGTQAAAEATIGLNQVRLINGQNELAVTGIREFIASNPDREYLPPAYGLLGAALENAAKPADAAEAYRNASEAADVDYLQASYLVEAGRALVTAGQRDEAAQLYREVVAEYPETPMTTEAKVRLAELTAGRM